MGKIKTSATPISWVCAAVIVYASLYPFSGWRNQEIAPWAFLWAPLPLYWTASDVFINLFGYVPFGFFLALTNIRVKHTHRQFSFNWLFGVLLSLVLESLQTYLPSRVPSTVDFLLNSFGTIAGLFIAYFCEKHRFIDSWSQIRSKWLIKESVGPLACLVVWPFAIIYPPTIPFLMGDVYWRVRIKLAESVMGTSLENLFSASDSTQFQSNPIEVVLCVMTGLLIPVLLGYSIVPGLAHRVWLTIAVFSSGVGVLMVSSALTFGMAHIFSWLSNLVSFGLVMTAFATFYFLKSTTKSIQLILLCVLTVHLILTNGIHSDVYLAQSIQIWEQGKNARFIGLTQWACLIWPYILFIQIVFRLQNKRIK
jgi:hypothetical protein